MRLDAPPITEHRLNRLHRWALLWLSWLARFLQGAAQFAPLSAQVEAIAHGWLDITAARIAGIVVLKGLYFRPRRFVQAPARHRDFALARKQAGFRRALIGSRLRRALKHRGDLAGRIEALMQNLDALIALWTQSRPHALTRRRPIRARREAGAPAPVHAAPTPRRCADTS